MMKLLLVTFLVGASALTLTHENWDSETAGKSVFVKFQAPWWGHCKSMKPAWDKLMEEFKDHKTIVVADVDCTAAGKELCSNQGVQGYPTIKTGDPSALEDFSGGRDFDALQAHAKSLKPSCSPANIDLCDADGKAAIEAVMALSDEDIAQQIADGDKKIADAGTHFDAELEKLQATYKELTDTKESTIKEVKASGLGMLKSIQAHKAKGDTKEAKEEL